jgi:hypothetical protein
MDTIIEEFGFVGNVWIRQNWLLRKGDTGGGHTHYHDHVSLLVRGSVEVQVDDNAPKQFVSPTFIVIKKDKVHKITALEDNTVYYCVFAMRDVNGEVLDIYQERNLPDYGPGPLPEYTRSDPETQKNYWQIDNT